MDGENAEKADLQTAAMTPALEAALEVDFAILVGPGRLARRIAVSPAAVVK